MAIVCHCNVVRERTIVKAIRRGAETISEVQSACGAATRCHGCEAAVYRLLDEHSVSVTRSASPLAPTSA